MQPRRLAISIVSLGLVALAVSACSSSAEGGWTFAPPPTPTAAPAVSPGASGGVASAAPSAAASGAASAAPPSAGASAPAGGTVLNQTAQGVQFQNLTFEVPAGQAFQIAFDNQDAGIPHNMQISDAGGTMVFEGETVNGVAQTTYNVPALAAGVYKFACKWHPNMVGVLTAK